MCFRGEILVQNSCAATGNGHFSLVARAFYQVSFSAGIVTHRCISGKLMYLAYHYYHIEKGFINPNTFPLVSSLRQ